METKILQIQGIEAHDLFNRLDRMETAITALTGKPQHAPSEPENYITRREVANLFKISLVTVNDWTQKGILQAYKIGNRVYYKRTEVEESMTKKRGKYVL